MKLFRATRCSLEFAFTSDCPNDVKANMMHRCLATVSEGKVVAVPPLFQQWVTVYESRTAGLMLPLIGFVSDERMAEISSRVRRAFRL
ncbi:hypothetical protein BurMR1_1891 [Burkholderia sp. MR1]|nr:hypothetical protein BurMR1_1891 [Burkholderia sp. MR1]